jgi:hypothetical protein
MGMQNLEVVLNQLNKGTFKHNFKSGCNRTSKARVLSRLKDLV